MVVGLIGMLIPMVMLMMATRLERVGPLGGMQLQLWWGNPGQGEGV